MAGSALSVARSGPANRRASRTVSGSGSHLAQRPSSTTGGATGASAMTCTGQAVGDVTVTVDVHDVVGELHDALEPVLGHAGR